jgi:hypothetical protein
MILAGHPSHLPRSHLPPRNHASCSSNCHRRPVIGVFRLVARSCVREAPNEEQGRHDGSRLALNARSCQAFLAHFCLASRAPGFAGKLSFIAAPSLPPFNGARQPQAATGIPSQSELVLSARWSVPAWKPPPGSRSSLKGQILHVGDSALGHRGHSAHYFGHPRFELPPAPRPFHPKGSSG